MYTILIADDDRQAVEVLRLRLSKAGYQVLVAHNGRDALAQYQRGMPKVVLLDAAMPDLSGFEVCELIRAQDHTRKCAIFIVSGASSPSPEYVTGCAHMSGCDGFVRKPYDSAQLLQMIRDHIETDPAREGKLCTSARS